jgi:hypothetical protein
LRVLICHKLSQWIDRFFLVHYPLQVSIKILKKNKFFVLKK